jgi:hypothetical protein
MYGFRISVCTPKNAKVSLYTGNGGKGYGNQKLQSQHPKSMGQSPSYGSFSKGQASAAFSFPGYCSQFQGSAPFNGPRKNANVPGKLQGRASLNATKCFSANDRCKGRASLNAAKCFSANGGSKGSVSHYAQKCFTAKSRNGFGNLIRTKMLHKVQSTIRNYSFAKGFYTAKSAPFGAILHESAKTFRMVGKKSPPVNIGFNFQRSAGDLASATFFGKQISKEKSTGGITGFASFARIHGSGGCDKKPPGPTKHLIP